MNSLPSREPSAEPVPAPAPPPAVPAARGDSTRDALVATALEVFARAGFHGVSTREIAQAAGVNQALIGYHFRHKEGLYLAVFEHIRQQITERIGPLADAIEAALEAGPASGSASGSADGSTPRSTPDTPAARRERYLPLLLRLTDGMAGLMAQEASAPWAQLIIREQQAPTAAFELLYDGFMGRVLGLLTRLVGRIHGADAAAVSPAPDDTAIRLQVVTILGQVMVFRAARAAVLRQMRWERIGDAELAAIRQQLHRGIAAMFPIEE